MKSLVTSKLTIVLIILLSFIVFGVSGKELDEDHHHLHDQHKYHLGFGIAGAYFPVNRIWPLDFTFIF